MEKPSIVSICFDPKGNLVGVDVNGEMWRWGVDTKGWAPYEGPGQ